MKKDDGTRAIGTILDPKGKAIESIKKKRSLLRRRGYSWKPYTTGYEPIRDAAHQVIGIFYVGYLKIANHLG